MVILLGDALVEAGVGMVALGDSVLAGLSPPGGGEGG